MSDESKSITERMINLKTRAVILSFGVVLNLGLAIVLHPKYGVQPGFAVVAAAVCAAWAVADILTVVLASGK